MAKNRKKKGSAANEGIQTRLISELKSHPAQAEMFGDVDDAATEDLAKSMDGDGLDYPPIILPDGTIIDGHQRVRAALRLGWKKIAVKVRYDLADDPTAAERALINANFQRRQMKTMAMARAINRLIEIDEGARPGRLDVQGRQAVKEAIARRFGMSVRHINRYLVLLRGPRVIQDAVDDEELTIDQASKAACLSRADLQEIVEGVKNGGSVRELVVKKVAPIRSAEDNTSKGFGKLITALRVALALNFEEIDVQAIARKKEVLVPAVGMLTQLLDRSAGQRAPKKSMVQELVEKAVQAKTKRHAG